MAGNWYKTGTVKVTKGSAVVTGTGTAWADNKQGIGPGQMFLVPGSGTVLMFEILSVDSNTQLTLVSAFTGTTATAAAYAIPSFYVDSVPDFARRLAAQLSYYQSQMDGWQQIMTGTGTIVMTAPDGTAVNISSFAKLTADINAAFHEYGALSGTDLNTLGSVASSGVYYQTANASATAALNYPEQKAGTLIVSKSAYSGCQQLYIPFDTGQIYMRGLTTNWNGTDGPWAVWKLVGAAYRTASSIDLNTLTGSALLVGGSYTNGPATMGNSSCFVTSIARNDSNLTAQTLNYTSTNRVFTRTNVSGTWSAWSEVITTANVPSARASLGLGYYNGLANPGGGVVRYLRYDDSGLMIVTRRFPITAAANSSTGWSYSWSSELSVNFTTYPALSVNGSGGNSADWKVGTESEGSAGCSGFIRNNNAAAITVWVTVTAIGMKA